MYNITSKIVINFCKKVLEVLLKFSKPYLMTNDQDIKIWLQNSSPRKYVCDYVDS